MAAHTKQLVSTVSSRTICRQYNQMPQCNHIKPTSGAFNAFCVDQSLMYSSFCLSKHLIHLRAKHLQVAPYVSIFSFIISKIVTGTGKIPSLKMRSSVHILSRSVCILFAGLNCISLYKKTFSKSGLKRHCIKKIFKSRISMLIQTELLPGYLQRRVQREFCRGEPA